MPKYKVIDGHKDIDNKEYAPGAIVETTAEIAARLRLEPVKEKTSPPPPGGEGDKTPKKLPADEAIAAIGKCATIDEVKEFFKGEERPTVVAAARAKIKAIKDAEKK